MTSNKKIEEGLEHVRNAEKWWNFGKDLWTSKNYYLHILVWKRPFWSGGQIMRMPLMNTIKLQHVLEMQSLTNNARNVSWKLLIVTNKIERILHKGFLNACKFICFSSKLCYIYMHDCIDATKKKCGTQYEAYPI